MTDPTRPVIDLPAAAAELGVALDETALARFDRYRELLLEHNRRMNLTRITEPDEIAAKHFLDSLSCLLAVPDDAGSLIDVGSGAGFPGLALKVARPDLHVALVESVRKKAAFLESVARELGLADVEVLDARAEDVGRDAAHRERYDVAVARAVSRLNVLAEYLLPLVRVGGTMLAQKGADLGEELVAAEAAFTELGGTLAEVRPVAVPHVEGERHLVVVRKTSPTPRRYPRRTGVPEKRPLR